jgi:hypothetical protein
MDKAESYPKKKEKYVKKLRISCKRSRARLSRTDGKSEAFLEI